MNELKGNNKFTTYLNVMLPTQDEGTFTLCSPKELFSMRETLYHILKSNDFQILYGPDYSQGMVGHRKKDMAAWKSKFLDPKFIDRDQRHCPASFPLAEDFLSIVARGKRDGEIKLVFLFAKSGAVKKEEILSYEAYVKKNRFDRCWVVADECTSQSKNFMQQRGEEPSSVQMRFVPFAKLKSNWTENIYVHKYRVITKKEQLDRNLKEMEKYPKILISDSACIQTLADVGDILVSTGPSVTAGEISQYKLVIPR